MVHVFKYPHYVYLRVLNVKVNEVKQGGYFGELGLMTHQPRATSIVAQGDVRLACKNNF